MKKLHKRKKNNKILYYAKNIWFTMFPRCLLRPFLNHRLKALDSRDDKDYILDRVDFYCKLTDKSVYDHEVWASNAVEIGKQKKVHPSVYYYDSMRFARWFPASMKWILLPGDQAEHVALPTILKSRPIEGDNSMSVIMKLDMVRHFFTVNDDKSFREKADRAVFRGEVNGERRSRNRLPFVERYFGNKMFDIGTTDNVYTQYNVGKLSIQEHLDFKFIMSLEGNDVASNLKWVMSTNSIAVMPRPKCETWFMESRLKPDYHYIEVKDDFSDVEEKLQYYIDHPEEGEAIVEHAHEWVAQFLDSSREKLISLLVLKKYFDMTSQ